MSYGRKPTAAQVANDHLVEHLRDCDAGRGKDVDGGMVQ